jgi:5'-methylthioinosine phosphorylase
MTRLAIIGGTGLTSLSTLQITQRRMVSTPYGEPSGPVSVGELAGIEVVFLPRHGHGHTIPPHRINYRANIWALKQIGVECVVAAAAVGGIHPEMGPGAIVIPNQIIDYTWGRGHTMFDKDLDRVVHVDFTEPYCPTLRAHLLAAGREAGLELFDVGTYGATQGPRLETAAEIRRMERDGCDLVGMTGMPEAALARELDLSYATCAVVANWAAGKSGGPITMEQIRAALEGGMERIRTLLKFLIPRV